ncbi:ATP-binding protein [Desulfovibrio aminophilus]|uniref:sensor histidine kinase n=1 Tax=Desulfovibrio aminophilus TaxID=81425 RepID=UPI003395A624
MILPDGHFALTIRQKVVLGIVVALLGLGLLGALSYHHLVQIDEALRLAEVVDDLANDILEVRRYEKNYLLYAQDEDRRESLRYADLGLERIKHIASAEAESRPGAMGFAGLRGLLARYKDGVLRLASSGGDKALAEAARNDLREQGKALVETSQRFVAAQRITILDIVNSLKRQLLLSIFGALGLGLAFVWFVGRGIIQALQLIGRSTARIARGDFSPLPVPATRDETRNVAEAFNRMIVELEKRQNQLVQEKKLASLGVLTSGIAHQLNNPLNNISTSCQILREEGVIREDEFTRELLDNIYHEVLRSRDIVKGLLEFSRVTDFSLKPVSLDAVVERSMRLVTSQLPAGVDISRDIPAELMVPMDAQRMQEVFLNLFINAMQAIKTSPGRITIQAEADTAANQAVIRVADTGTGIAPENLGRIFDPFYTLKEVGKGTGLGLSIVFGIIKKHGGTIVAENRQDGQTGAVFTIRLPLERPGREEA